MAHSCVPLVLALILSELGTTLTSDLPYGGHWPCPRMGLLRRHPLHSESTDGASVGLSKLPLARGER